ncbi:MAG: tetratricopeptide repeat protein [Verrucomicrobiia bacterium]
MLTILKKSLVRIYLCGLCIAIAIIGGCSKPQQKALSRGNTLLNQGKYAEAATVFKELTTAMPNEARVWNLLGIAYHQSGDLVAAAHSYATALKLSNNFYVVHYNLGCALFEMQNYLQSSREFASYVMYEPRSATGWTKLGASQLFIRQYDLSEKSFRTALSLDPNSYEAYNGLGIALIYNKRWQEAFQCFSKALKIKPDYPPANLNMGIFLLQYQKDKTNALTMFKRFLMLKPSHLYTSSVSNLVYKIEHQPQRVQTNQTGQIQPLQPVVSAAAPIQEEQNKPAKPTAEKAESIHPVSSSVSQTKPLISAGGAQKPVVEKQNPDEQKSPLDQKVAKIQETNQIKQSLQPPEQQAAKPPPQTKPQQSSNQEIQTSPDSEKTVKTAASETASSATEIKTNSEPLLASKNNNSPPAQPQTQPPQQKEPPQKKSIFEKLNPFKKKSTAKPVVTPLPPISEKQSETLQQQTVQKTETKPAAAPVEEIKSQLEKKPVSIAKVEQPQFPRYRYINPQKPTQGDREEALKQFESGLKAHNSGDLNVAKERYLEAIKSDPSLYEANYNLAVVFYELGDIDQALVYYELALAINPESKNARFNFAIALQKAKFIYDAANEYEKYLNINPQDSRARLLLANIYAQQLNDKTNAAKHYLEVLKLEPNNPQALAITEWLKQNFPQ